MSVTYPVIPQARFSPDEMPWARSIESAVASLQLAADRSAQSHTNTGNGLSGAIQTLAAQVSAVQGLEAGLQTQINNLVGATVNTTTLNASSAVNTASVTATVAVSAPTGTFPTGVNSVGVYNNLVSTGGYKVQYINASGAMGYVPSSRRFKQDIVVAPDTRAAALAVEIVTFRYKEAVKELGDAAALEWGVIAEDVHELGLTWLVDYDDDGLPLGVKYERLGLAVIPVIQDLEARLSAAGL